MLRASHQQRVCALNCPNYKGYDGWRCLLMETGKHIHSALQAGCREFDSLRLHQSPVLNDSECWFPWACCRSALRITRFGYACGSWLQLHPATSLCRHRAVQRSTPVFLPGPNATLSSPPSGCRRPACAGVDIPPSTPDSCFAGAAAFPVESIARGRWLLPHIATMRMAGTSACLRTRATARLRRHRRKCA